MWHFPSLLGASWNEKNWAKCVLVLYYCIIISFTSIFEKHLSALSEHRSYQTCAKDENNAKETMRLFYTTVFYKSSDRSERPFFYSAFRPHFCPQSVMLMHFFLWYSLDVYFSLKIRQFLHYPRPRPRVLLLTDQTVWNETDNQRWRYFHIIPCRLPPKTHNSETHKI